MFVAITNTPRDYAWGALGEISALLGREASGAPEAELWLGAHPGSPSRIVDPAQVGGAPDLGSWIAADPRGALGPRWAEGARLPFLLKVLAAGSPLSLQAHPTSDQARLGFARENAAGLPLDAPNRNYKDAFSKPELIYALSDEFDALCGFRSAAEIRATITRLIELDAASQSPRPGPVYQWLDRMGGDESLRSVFEWLIEAGEGVQDVIQRVVELARDNPLEFPTVVMLADTYPNDPGIVISILLHRVRLARGEALYLPAGNIHAYLQGLGIELMSASDNVLRGGLTPKHVDVPELLDVLDFRAMPVPYLVPEMPSSNVQVLRPEGQDFVLVRVHDVGRYDLTGPAIVLCVDGTLRVTGSESTADISRGTSLFVTPDERRLEIAGRGVAFIATTAGVIRTDIWSTR